MPKFLIIADDLARTISKSLRIHGENQYANKIDALPTRAEIATRSLVDSTDEQFRAEALRRGFALHSKQFSEQAQKLLREIPDLRKRLNDMEAEFRRVSDVG